MSLTTTPANTTHTSMAKSGWCMTEQHDLCRYVLCSCKHCNHTQEERQRVARKYVYVDDLTGKELAEDTQPIRLSLGRRTWTLHLSDDSTTKLYEALEPFTKDADSVEGMQASQSAPAASSGSGKRTRRTAEEVAREEAAREEKAAQRDQMRKWAEEENSKGSDYKVPGDRGRIQAALVEEFYNAHPDLTKHWA